MTPPTHPLLGVVPVTLGEPADLDALLRCVVSLWSTTRGIDLVVVSHGDVDPVLAGQLVTAMGELGIALEQAGPGAGRQAAANRGLELALALGTNALLVDPRVEFSRGDEWLAALRARAAGTSPRVGVVGGRVLKTNETIHRAGFLFSRLTRVWHPRFEWAPADLPEALLPTRCPVAGGFELLTHALLREIGPFDAAMPAPLDSIDLCLRAYAAGFDCLYEPAAVASWNGPLSMTSPSRQESHAFDTAWNNTDLSPWVPPIR